jgi:small neutral amino acid transporter SnatA (MarC family)
VSSERSGLRVVLIYFALQLLAVPYLKIVGGLLLFWIGIKLVMPETRTRTATCASSTLAGAIKTIIVADAVMSVDNVIAVAGAAHGSIVLVVFGIAVSIPIVVWGSKLVLAADGSLPGGDHRRRRTAGLDRRRHAAHRPGRSRQAGERSFPTAYLASALGALLVVAAGKWLAQPAA